MTREAMKLTVAFDVLDVHATMIFLNGWRRIGACVYFNDERNHVSEQLLTVTFMRAFDVAYVHATMIFLNRGRRIW